MNNNPHQHASSPAPAHHARHWLAGLALLATVCGTALAVPPSHQFSVPRALDGGHEWVCLAERGYDGDWVLRCDDLGLAMRDDPVLRDSAAPKGSRLIPLYGAPFADSPLPELASAVLCGRRADCSAMVATW